MGEHVIATLDVGLQQQIDQFFINYSSGTTNAYKRKIFYDATAQQIVIALEASQSESGKSQNFTDIKVSASATTYIARFYRNVELPKPTSSSSLSSLPTVFNIKRENIFNAKYSPDEKVIAIQYTQTLVEFVLLADVSSFTQSCKKIPNNQILNFYWTYSDNLFFVTSTGIELFSQEKGIKITKGNKTTNWLPKLRVLLVSSGQGPFVYAFLFTQNNIVKIPKFQLEKAEKSTFKTNELQLCTMYNKLYCVHNNSAKQEITLYHITREVVLKKYSIPMPINSDIYCQVWDSLLVVHDLGPKVAMVYDIRDKEFNQPVGLPLPLSISVGKSTTVKTSDIIAYAAEWVFDQPGIVLDTSGFRVLDVSINLEAITLSFTDKKRLVEFLMKRTNTKTILLRVLKNIITEYEALVTVAEIFDLINSVLAASMNNDGQKDKGNTGYWFRQSLPLDDWGQEEKAKSGNTSPRTYDGVLLLDQIDMYKHVFLPLEEEKGPMNYRFVIAVLTEYLRSLHFHHIPVEPYLNELLINLLVRNKQFYQLHQLLQYHVIGDFVHVACQLLAIESSYPPAYQLALDMFKRLKTNEEILEVLVTKKQIITAIRFIKSHKGVKYSPQRILDAALAGGDQSIFFTAYKFFEHAKQLHDCQMFTEKFHEFFDKAPEAKYS